MKGFDAYSPADDRLAGLAVSLGYEFQGCYYGTGGKVLQPRNLSAFAQHGLRLFMFFERNALRALQGASAASADVELAVEQAGAVSQPSGTAITFTVDTDVDMNERTSGAAVMSYFEEIARGMGKAGYRVGVYGSGDVCDRVKRAGLANVTVEAGAGGWRGSKSYTPMVQQHPEVLVPNQLGVGYDPLDTELTLDQIGAWSAPGGVAMPAPPLPVSPSPIMEPRVASFVSALRGVEQFFTERKLYNGPIDNDPGPGVRYALRTYLASLRK